MSFTVNECPQTKLNIYIILANKASLGQLAGNIRHVTHMITITTRMWANAQPDGRPAEHRWRPLFNAAKFG